MNKLRRVFLLLLLLFAVSKVDAASIKGITIDGDKKATVGSEFVLTFEIAHDGIDKTSNLGIISSGFIVDYDDKVFSIIDGKSDDFDVSILKNDGKYYAVGTVKNNETLKNKCSDKKLHCADVKIKLTFYVRDTDVTSSTIGVTDIETLLLETNGDYDVDKAIDLEVKSTKSHEVTIEKATSTIKEEPKTAVVDKELESLISELDKKISSVDQNEPIETGESNAYLKTLKIENHRIKFDKEVFEYNIYIDKNINELEITAEPDSSTSTVTIIGADDLKSNENKVTIEVVSETDEKNTYVINAKEKPESQIIKEKEEKPKFKIDKKYIYIGAGFLGVLLIILLIYALINHRENKKLNKLLKEFDKY